MDSYEYDTPASVTLAEERFEELVKAAHTDAHFCLLALGHSSNLAESGDLDKSERDMLIEVWDVLQQVIVAGYRSGDSTQTLMALKIQRLHAPTYRAHIACEYDESAMHVVMGMGEGMGKLRAHLEAKAK